MAFVPRDPEEYELRRKIYKMDRAELKSEIRKTKDSLNRKLKKLESSGLHRYSRTYTKVQNFLIEELNTMGGRFISRPVANASVQKRQEFLLQLKRFDTYEGLTPEGIINSYKKAAEKLSTGDLTVTANDLMTIDDYMKMWREHVMHSNIASMFTSDEARALFVEKRSMSQKQFDTFMSELEKFETKEYKQKDFDVFLRYYNFEKGKVIAERNGIKFNPMNGKIYGDDDEIIRTSYRISADGSTLLRNKKNEKKLSDFTEESFYDYIFANKRKKR